MPTNEEIAQQQELLETNRRTLAHYIQQQAVHGGSAYAPPGVAHGIREARDNIHHIKTTLRGWGESVEDYPDDEETVQTASLIGVPPPQQATDNQTPSQNGEGSLYQPGTDSPLGSQPRETPGHAAPSGTPGHVWFVIAGLTVAVVLILLVRLGVGDHLSATSPTQPPATPMQEPTPTTQQTDPSTPPRPDTIAPGNASDVVAIASPLGDILEEGEELLSLAIAPAGHTIAVGSNQGNIYLWQIPDGTLLHRIEGHKGAVTGVAFSPDSEMLVSGGADYAVRLWDVEDGEQPDSDSLRQHNSQVWSVAFAPSGRLIASGAEDHTVRLWNVNNGAHDQLNCTKAGIRSVAFSPDGEKLVAGANDGTVCLWDIADESRLYERPAMDTPITNVVIAPNSQTFATSAEDGSITLWQIETGQVVRTFHEATDQVPHIAFSPDGQLLISASPNGPVELWQVETGQRVHTLHGSTDWVQAVAFTPDGRMIVSASRDGTVRLWGLKQDQE